jgi:hypothetical protein
MSAGFTAGGFGSGALRRVLNRPVALIAIGGVLAGCAESPSAPAKDLVERPEPIWAPNIAAAVNFNAIDYSLGVAAANTIIFVIQGNLQRPFAFPGHVFQSALSAAKIMGFPTDRDKFLVVSNGDARTIGADMSFGGCVADPTFGSLCDQGGIDVLVYVHPGATKIEVDVRYFSVDYTPFEDPFRIFIVDGAAVQVFQATITSEFGVKPQNGQLLFGPFRRMSVNATPYRGRVIVIRFLAADNLDTVFPSGALIDNLKVF